MYVKDAESKGLLEVVCLHERMPPAISIWIKNYANKFNDGFKTSFVHVIEDSLALVEGFRAYCEVQGITANQPKYTEVYWSWAQDCPE